MTQIPKNLKVGDTYVDEYTFEIYHVCDDGTYWAKRVDTDERPKITNTNVKKNDSVVEEKAQPSHFEDTPEKITEESVNYSKTQINRLPNVELEKLCKKLGLEVGTGTEMKRAIIAKLGL